MQDEKSSQRCYILLLKSSFSALFLIAPVFLWGSLKSGSRDECGYSFTFGNDNKLNSECGTSIEAADGFDIRDFLARTISVSPDADFQYSRDPVSLPRQANEAIAYFPDLSANRLLADSAFFLDSIFGKGENDFDFEYPTLLLQDPVGLFTGDYFPEISGNKLGAASLGSFGSGNNSGSRQLSISPEHSKNSSNDFITLEPVDNQKSEHEENTQLQELSYVAKTPFSSKEIPSENESDSGGNTDAPDSGSDSGDNTDAPDSGSDSGDNTDAPDSGSDSGGNTDAPDSGSDSGDNTDAPDSGSDSGDNTDAPDSGSDSGGNTDAPDSGSDSGDNTDAPDSGSDSGGNTDAPDSGSDSGDNTDAPDSGSDSGDNTDAPDSGSDSGGNTDAPDSGSDSGDNTDAPDSGSDSGDNTDAPDSGSDSGDNTDAPDSGSDSGGSATDIQDQISYPALGFEIEKGIIQSLWQLQYQGKVSLNSYSQHEFDKIWQEVLEHFNKYDWPENDFEIAFSEYINSVNAEGNVFLYRQQSTKASIPEPSYFLGLIFCGIFGIMCHFGGKKREKMNIS
jgi:hypothetical protein